MGTLLSNGVVHVTTTVLSAWRTTVGADGGAGGPARGELDPPDVRGVTEALTAERSEVPMQFRAVTVNV